jgi:hypothetical protein
MLPIRFLVAGAAILSLAGTLAIAQPAAPPAGQPPTPMGLTSTSFTDGGIIPDK